MKKTFILLACQLFGRRFLALGFMSIVAQVVIQRELINGFYGNEFFIGVVLTSWFLWTALGSAVLGRLFDRVGILIFLAGLVFFLEIFLIRLLKNYIGFPGEIPNLAYGMLAAFFAPAPICLLLGAWWTSGTKEEPKSVSNAYFIELIGFIIGGILFSFVLVKFQEFKVAVILIIIALVSIILSLSKDDRLLKWLVALLFLIFLSLLFTPYLSKLNDATIAYRYKGQELLESKNTHYGNIAVTKLGLQYNFYENGVPIGATEKIQFVEDLAHLSLFYHPDPKKVLLIGGGFTGVIGEILKHNVDEVFYLELDPEIIKITKKYLPKETSASLTGPRVKIINTDGRYFLKNSGEKFDVMIINLPPPSTALINRYYTKDFFKTVRERLATDGIFVNYLPYSPSTPSKTLDDLNSSVYKTLKSVFNKVLTLPEDVNFFISSTGQNITYEPQTLIDRFNERKIKTDYFIKDYITYRLTTDRIQIAENLFRENKTAKINKDFFPISYFYQNLFWLDHFYPKFSRIFEKVSAYSWIIFAAIAIILAVPPFTKGGREGINNSSLFSMGVAGFSLMALEMAVIFIYQIVIGCLYYRIALLISALMLGMAFGVWLGKRAREAYKFHILIILFCAVLPLVLIYLQSELVILLCAVISGLLGSAIFPIASKNYQSASTGTVYSADLLGSAFGAILPVLILIPVFGIYNCLIFICLINILAILILHRGKFVVA